MHFRAGRETVPPFEPFHPPTSVLSVLGSNTPPLLCVGETMSSCLSWYQTYPYRALGLDMAGVGL